MAVPAVAKSERILQEGKTGRPGRKYYCVDCFSHNRASLIFARLLRHQPGGPMI
jgi:hypothetical protein